MKTWLATVAQSAQDQSTLLREKAASILLNRELAKKNTEIFISGIKCSMTLERSANMLIHHLDKEQQELISLCNKYNKYLLEREAIVKTKLFRKIVRSIDVAKDLFFFESFSRDGSSEVFGDVQSLENSIVTSGMYRIAEEVSAYEVPSEFNMVEIRKRIKHLINEAKNLLWKRRSDVGLVYQKRIPIQLLDPPDRTKNRIIRWKECGFNPKVVAHRDSFSVTLPDFCVRLLRDCFTQKQKEWYREFNQEILEKQDHPDRYHSKEFAVDLVSFSMFKLLSDIQPNPLHRDPIIYHEEGDWTVVIDQYASYPKEKDVMRAVKDYYKILGNEYGIFAGNN